MKNESEKPDFFEPPREYGYRYYVQFEGNDHNVSVYSRERLSMSQLKARVGRIVDSEDVVQAVTIDTVRFTW